MMKPVWYFGSLIVIVAFSIGCSKAPDLKGTWKNSDNSTLEFVNDTAAVMGQEGVEGSAEGTYWVKGDTVWVKSMNEMVSVIDTYNLFTFYHQQDSLYLVRISLHRGDDFQTLEGEEFSRRLGKSPDELAFVKTGVTNE